MAPILAPYNSAMKLGSGFNSYTQQLCLHNAVVQGTPLPKPPPEDEKSANQSVVFKTSVIDRVSELTDALNISGALTIKYNNLIDGNGKGTFINSNKIKDADINFLFSVKVINQTVTDNNMTEFAPVENLSQSIGFTPVYGDTFISGFQEGGEFNAVVSIKVRDKNQRESIKADAAVALSTPSFGSKTSQSKNPAPKRKITTKTPNKGSGNGAVDGNNGDNQTPPETPNDNQAGDPDEEEDDPDSSAGLTIRGNAKVRKQQQALLSENEITISVSYTGGGQGLKSPDEDWNIDTLRRAALRFPSLVSSNPVYTHAVLTKYTSLKSFYAKLPAPQDAMVPLSYDNVGVYTATLQDAFLDYKNLAKDIHFLETEVDSGAKSLKESTFSDKDSKTPANREDPPVKEDPPAKEEAAAKEDPPAKEEAALKFVNKPYPATLAGLESARFDIRQMVNVIMKEIDNITKDPNIASSDRPLPCQCPILFKQYLPIGVPVDA